MHKDYKITFGGAEYVLNSDDGGLSGSVFELGADRSKVSFAYLWPAQEGNEPRVSRFGRRLAEGDEIVVDLESAVDAADNSQHDGDLAGVIKGRAAAGDPVAQLMQMLGYDRDVDDGDEPYYCGECDACKAAEAEAN